MRIVLTCICLSILSTFLLDAQSLYTITRKMSISGNEYWDHMAVDEASDRLFVAHGNMVQVLDLAKGHVVDSITGLSGVHAIALAPSLNKGFITNGRANTVTVFDLSTYAVQATVTLKGTEPDAIVYDAASQYLFVMNAKSTSVTVIRAESNDIVKEIFLEGKPQAAVCDGKGYVYVNIEDKSDICVLSTKSLKIEKTFSLAPGENPTALAIDPFASRLYAACSNRMLVVVDSHNGKIVAKVNIMEHPDGLVFDPVAAKLFCSSDDGMMTIIDVLDPNSYKIYQNMATSRGAHSCVFHSKRRAVYTATAEHVYPAVTGEVLHPKPVPKPNSCAVFEVMVKAK